MKNFKIGDRVVLNNNISEDHRVLLAPGDTGTIVSIQTFKSCDVSVLKVEMDESDLQIAVFTLMGDEVNLVKNTPIESIPDYWEPDLLMAMGYRGLI